MAAAAGASGCAWASRMAIARPQRSSPASVSTEWSHRSPMSLGPLARHGSLLDGPINGDWFEAYVTHILAPTLRPGDVVIMDNLSSHKRARTRKIIEERGAELRFLPPYSPDFNPIEMAFAKLKALLRKAAERTVDGLWNAIGRLVDVFTPHECANYFSAAGYDAD